MFSLLETSFFDIKSLLFAFCAFNMLASAFLVTSSRNSIHSIFYLIFTFFNASGILLILNIEFLALTFLIIYVGAIAVLFLFVVMMLNVKIMELNDSFVRYLPLSIFIAVVFFIECVVVTQNSLTISFVSNDFLEACLINNNLNWIENLDYLTNIQLVGQLLYNYYVLAFLLASIVLLLAMIGSIVLTLETTTTSKKQLFYKQIGTVKNL